MPTVRAVPKVLIVFSTYLVFLLFLPTFSFPLRCRAVDCNATYGQKLVKEEDYKGFQEQQQQQQDQQQQQQQQQQDDQDESTKAELFDRPLPYLKRRPNFYEDFLA